MKFPKTFSCTGCGAKPRLLGMLGMTASFMLVELIVGNLTNSMALVADSFHMLSDVIALVIAYVSITMSPKEWSKNTFGWARAEVVGALVNSVFLVALCFSISVESIKRFLDPEEIKDPKLILIVGGVGLGINLVGMLLFGDVGHGHSHGGSDSPKEKSESHEKANGHGHSHEKENGHGHSHGGHGHGHSSDSASSGHSMNITGVFLHVLADALGSVVVCITSLVIMLTDWEYRFYLDPVLSLVIVLIILVSTWPLLRDSTLILLNTIPAHIDLLDLETRLVTTVAGVSSIHELHVWRLVGRRVVASCHLEMTPPPLGTEPVDHHMDVARQVKEFFHKAGIHSTTVQLEYWSPKLSRAGEKNDLGSCQLTCPRKESSSSGEFKASTECVEDTCCRERLGATKKSIDMDIDIMTYM
jgi:zinc transporter 1